MTCMIAEVRPGGPPQSSGALHLRNQPPGRETSPVHHASKPSLAHLVLEHVPGEPGQERQQERYYVPCYIVCGHKFLLSERRDTAAAILRLAELLQAGAGQRKAACVPGD